MLRVNVLRAQASNRCVIKRDDGIRLGDHTLEKPARGVDGRADGFRGVCRGVEGEDAEDASQSGSLDASVVDERPREDRSLVSCQRQAPHSCTSPDSGGRFAR